MLSWDVYFFAARTIFSKKSYQVAAFWWYFFRAHFNRIFRHLLLAALRCVTLRFVIFFVRSYLPVLLLFRYSVCSSSEWGWSMLPNNARRVSKILFLIYAIYLVKKIIIKHITFWKFGELTMFLGCMDVLIQVWFILLFWIVQIRSAVWRTLVSFEYY